MAEIDHRFLDVAGVRTFCRLAGPRDAPVVLLPHGYPCSSYEFRNLIPLLADSWRVIAPDFPGSGYTDTPADFEYSFDGYAVFLEQLLDQLQVGRYSIYLHDFGSQIGLRLAMRRPDRVAALIVQNGDIYEDELGPKYAALKRFWRNPSPDARAKLADAITEEGFKDEFLNDVRPELVTRISPDLWKLHWALTTPRRRGIYHQVIAGLRENLAWFPRYQQYLRDQQPPTLIVWGPQDGFMPEGAARAWLRDLHEAELHLLDGGHWLLETNLTEVAMLMRGFLARNEKRTRPPSPGFEIDRRTHA